MGEEVHRIGGESVRRMLEHRNATPDGGEQELLNAVERLGSDVKCGRRLKEELLPAQLLDNFHLIRVVVVSHDLSEQG